MVFAAGMIVGLLIGPFVYGVAKGLLAGRPYGGPHVLEPPRPAPPPPFRDASGVLRGIGKPLVPPVPHVDGAPR